MKGSRLPLILLVAGVALFVAHAVHFLPYANDDAYITFRYSRFLATGRGPYFNPGEHVEGYSNLLWMLVMAPVYALGGVSAVAPFAKGLGLLCGGACLVFSYLLCRRLSPDAERGPRSIFVAGPLAAGLLAVAPSFALNSVSGLETAFYSSLLTLGVLLGTLSASDGRWRGAGVAFAAAALTRPEGAALFAVYAAAQGASAWRGAARDGLGAPREVARRLGPLIADVLLVALAAAGQLAFRWLAYDGEWLPNTYYAKAGGVGSVTSWEYVRQGALSPFLGFLGIAAAAAGFWLGGLRRRAVLPVACTAVAGALLPLVTGPDWMLGWRLVAPVLPLLAAVVAMSWTGLAARWIGRPTWLAPTLLLALLPVAAWTESGARAAFDRIVTVRARGYDEGHVALARWLHGGAAKPGDTVALMDIGIVGYLCDDLRILDITGLTDRHIAKSPGTFLEKRYDPAYVLDRRPEIIVIVFAAEGDPRRPPENLHLVPWSPEEDAILASQEFRREYVRPREAPGTGDPWTVDLARSLGAERVFHHAYPDRFYLLAAFRRRPPPGAQKPNSAPTENVSALQLTELRGPTSISPVAR
ncbi:MAG: hypothetical protein LAO51_13715 [Acidobacteriia bacterium]|nr:hypothetical protein [Terriglobia bacterium]